MIPPNVSSLRFVLVSFFRSVDLVIKRHAVQNVCTCIGFRCNPCPEEKRTIQNCITFCRRRLCTPKSRPLYYNRSKLENIPTTLNLKRQYLSTIVRLQLYPCHVFANSSKWPVQKCPSHESLADNAKESTISYTQFVLYILYYYSFLFSTFL